LGDLIFFLKSRLGGDPPAGKVASGDEDEKSEIFVVL
jgi:hypothetical protein